jgi:hypothetical protein
MTAIPVSRISELGGVRKTEIISINSGLTQRQACTRRNQNKRSGPEKFLERIRKCPKCRIQQADHQPDMNAIVAIVLFTTK